MNEFIKYKCGHFYNKNNIKCPYCSDSMDEKLEFPLNKPTQISNLNNCEVFISYGWSGESETIVDILYGVLKERKIEIIRDKIDLRYKGDIKAFMERIGKGKFVIVIISDKYLKSENCMFEMLEIKKHGDVYDRIFPIVLKDAKIYDEIDRIDYLNYWDDKIQQLQEKIKTIKNPVGTGQVIEKINQYNDIRRIIDEITGMLRNMNTLTPDIHKNNDFSQLISLLELKQNVDTENKIVDLLPSELIGTKVNNYVLTDYIHSGGFGAVFKAKHIHLDTVAAIKISHQITHGFRNLDNIVSVGLKGLKHLDHPNIVRTEDFTKMAFKNDERLVIIMEFIEGGTLKELPKINLTKTEVNSRILIFKKICNAIYHAHTLKYRNSAGFTVTGLMHGDIKPANILLTKNLEPKIMDFMFVDMNRLLEIEVNAPAYVNIADYATAAFGTIGYMPPEQEIQGEVNEQTDIYSLGILLFEMFVPLQYNNFDFKNKDEIDSTIKQYNKNISKSIAFIIFKATKSNPNERYSNVSDMLIDLEGNKSNFIGRIFGK